MQSDLYHIKPGYEKLSLSQTNRLGHNFVICSGSDLFLDI